MDRNLKFHSHSCNVTNKASQILGIIKKNFTLLDGHKLPLLYKSLVWPHLEYASEAWGPTYLTDCQNIESVQRKATRSISKKSSLPYSTRLQHLLYHRHRADMIMMYNPLYNNLDIDPSKLLNNWFDTWTQLQTLQVTFS